MNHLSTPLDRAEAYRLDHVVHKVDDLAEACADFAAAGFTVDPGGEHPGRGSRNALVPFVDGAYLELIAFQAAAAKPDLPAQPAPRQPAPPQPTATGPLDRWDRWRTRKEGLVDYALLPERVEAAIASAARRGLALEGPLAGGRLRPDGVQVSWQLALPDGADLPFLCADVTPRSFRVPEGAAREHKNGAAGIDRIVVAVEGLDFSAARYRSLLGVEPRPCPRPPLPDARALDFSIGHVTITLAAPAGRRGRLAESLAERGEGPCALYVSTKDPRAAGVLPLHRAHGAHVELCRV